MYLIDLDDIYLMRPGLLKLDLAFRFYFPEPCPLAPFFQLSSVTRNPDFRCRSASNSNSNQNMQFLKVFQSICEVFLQQKSNKGAAEIVINRNLEVLKPNVTSAHACAYRTSQGKKQAYLHHFQDSRSFRFGSGSRLTPKTILVDYDGFLTSRELLGFMKLPKSRN